MPNNGRITLCPYYKNERALTVSCEDCVRRFRYPAHKKQWMDTYCDKDWKSCPYAIDLEKTYQEGGDLVEHELSAVKKELKKTVNMFERRKRSDEAKAEEIKKLRRKCKLLEQRNIDLVNKDRRAREMEKKAFDQIQSITQMYEGRFAYMIAEWGGGTLNEADVEAWAKGKSFAIVADEKGSNGETRVWKVLVKDETGRSKSDDAGTGSNETASRGHEKNEG